MVGGGWGRGRGRWCAHFCRKRHGDSRVNAVSALHFSFCVNTVNQFNLQFSENTFPRFLNLYCTMSRHSEIGPLNLSTADCYISVTLELGPF